MQDAPPPIESAMSSEERNWGMLCHLSALAKYLIPVGGNILGPLIIWLIKKDAFPFVDDQGKESLNFQISVTIYLIVALVLIFAVVGLFLVPALLIFDLVMIVIASTKASSGVAYRYPLTIRFVK
jgi:uncharacterized Tic20 family protein